MKPFLKWAGNKYPIIERIKPLLPEGKRLIEPFTGSGAVFLNTAYSQYLLTDANNDLIHLYLTLQEEGLDFIAYSRQYFSPETNRSDCFYELRALFNATQDSRLKSALFLYLNRHTYNGLCRYNAKGGFNVPFGKYAKPYFPYNEMLFFIHKSKNAIFKTADFLETMHQAQEGDVVYCDPPCAPLSSTANFTAYSAGGFTWDDQLKLAQTAEALAQRGITVVLSNHDTEPVRDAYLSADITPFTVQRFISCRGAHRAKAGEVLATFKSTERVG